MTQNPKVPLKLVIFFPLNIWLYFPKFLSYRDASTLKMTGPRCLIRGARHQDPWRAFLTIFGNKSVLDLILTGMARATNQNARRHPYEGLQRVQTLKAVILRVLESVWLTYYARKLPGKFGEKLDFLGLSVIFSCILLKEFL